MKKTIFILSAAAMLTFMFCLSCETDPPSLVDQSTFSAGEDIVKELTGESFTQSATGAEGNGVTVYSSSNVDVATVDFLTGEVDIRSCGVSTITAYNTGDQSYNSASDSYQLTVTSTEFITTWLTTSADEAITIPTNISKTYDYSIDWGDGTSSTNVTEDATHSYAEAGIHAIIITGLFPQIYFNGYQGSYTKILSIDQWGSNKWDSMAYSFYGCSNLTITATDSPDLSLVSNTRFMFCAAASLDADLSAWDVSNVTDMWGMFWNASSFNSDIGGWDVSKVTSMLNMLRGTSSFTNHDLSGWNVTNVTDHTDFSTDWGSGNTVPVWP